MARREELAEGVVRVGVEDYGVAEKLAALDAEFKAAMEALGRKEATVKIKGNIDDLKRALAAAKAEILKTDAEIAAIEDKRAATQDEGWKTRYKAQLDGLKQIRDAQALEARQVQSRMTLQQTFFQQQQNMWRAQDQAFTRRKAEAAFEDERARVESGQYVERTKQAQHSINLEQQYYDARKRVSDLEAAAARAPQSERIKIDLDTQRAIADMTRFHAEAQMIGNDAITQEVKVDTSRARKAFNYLTQGAIDPAEKETKKFSQILEDLGKVNVNFGPFNANLKGLILTLGSLSPVVLGLIGSLGSLVSVLGSGIVGAAGLGGGALAGFSLAAVGVGSAIHNSLSQLSTFKQALGAFQTAQLQYGPPGLKAPTGPTGPTPAQQAAAARNATAIPIDQQRVAIDQRAVTDALAKYGAQSIQASRASLTLASAQRTLQDAQLGTTASSGRQTTAVNRTQTALNRLNSTIAQSSPPLRAAEHAWITLSGVWAKLTGGTASRDVGAALSASFTAANANVNWFARDTNKALDSLTVGWSRWMQALAAPEGRRILSNLFGNFDKTIRPVMDGVGQLAAALGRWFSTMSNFLPSIARGFDNWARGVNNASRATDGWSNHAGSLIDSLKSIGHFALAAFNYLTALFAPGVRPGQSFLDDMANSLNRTAAAMRSVSGQRHLTDFFENSIKLTEGLFNALKPLLGIFVNLAALFTPLARDMVPILSFFTHLVQDVTSAGGPLGTLLEKLTAFWLTARLIGKLGSIFGALTQLREAGGIIARAALAFAAFRSGSGFAGSFRAMADAWKKSANVSVSASIEEALKVGGSQAAAAIADALKVGGLAAGEEMAKQIVAAGGVAGDEVATGAGSGGKVASEEVTAGMVEGGRLAGAEIATEERVGGIGVGGAGLGAGAAAEGGLLARLGLTGGTLAAGGAAALGGSFLQKPLGLRGGTAGTVGGAGVGLLAGAAIAGPLGAAIGAGIGATIGPTVAHSIGNALGIGRPGGIQTQARGTTNALALTTSHLIPGQTQGQFNREIQSASEDLNRAIARVTTNQYDMFGHIIPPTAADKSKVQKYARELGDLVAKELHAGLQGGTHLISPNALVSDITLQLNKLRPAARDAAAKSMIEMATTLQREGRLPKGSVAFVIRQLEAEFPSLRNYLKKTGETSAQDFTKALDLKDAIKKTSTGLEDIRARFHWFNIDADVNGSNLFKNLHTAYSDIQKDLHSKTKSIRDEGKQEWHAYMQDVSGITDQLQKNVSHDMDKIRGTVSGKSAQAAVLGNKNFQRLANVIWSWMDSGRAGTEKGSNKILQALQKALGQLGVKTKFSDVQVGAIGAATATNAGVTTAIQNITSPFSAPGGATGLRVPGPVGPDNWTLVDPSGRPAARVGGNEILVTNRHTEHRVDKMLSRFGTSLGKEVANERRPHSYQTGGYVYPFVNGTSIGRTDQGIDANMPVGSPIGPMGDSTVLGINPSWYHGQPYVWWRLNSGPRAGALAYVAEQITNVAQPGTHLQANQAVARYAASGTGIEYGWAAPGGQTLAQATTGYTEGQVTTAGSSMRAFLAGLAHGVLIGGPNGGRMWTNIKAPHVSGGGQLGHLVNAGLKRVTDAANKFGRNKTSSLGGVGGTGNVTASNLMAISRSLGYNWSGSEIQDWLRIISQESGGNPLAQNPRSTAFGIGQFLDTTWGSYGTSQKTTNAHLQLVDMAKYIHGKYGTPSAAEAYHLAHNSYALGGRMKRPAAKFAGAFANGGMFTTNGPTVGLFGENGTPETVIAIPHAQTGIRVPHKATPTHGTTGNVPLTPAQKEAEKEQKYRTAANKAKKTYDDYNYKIHHEHHPGHYTNHGRTYVPGGPTQAEMMELHKLYREWKHDAQLAKINAPTASFATATDIPPKDRIGGIGTDDIQAALQNAQTALQNAPSKTKKQRAHKEALRDRVAKLQGLLTSASSYIADFTNLENEIQILGQYVDGAGAATNGKFPGYDPGMGATPNPSRRLSTKTWSEWKNILLYWEKKHAQQLHGAVIDVRKRLSVKSGPDKGKLIPGVNALQYVQTLAGDYATALSDEEALAASTDPHAPGAITSVDDYIGLLHPGIIPDTVAGETPADQIARLNYQFSVAQGLVQPDIPGTPAREDLVSLGPEIAVAGQIRDFYQAVFNRVSHAPDFSRNYPLLTSASDAYNSARDQYNQLNQQVTDAAAVTGPSQLQLVDTARAAILESFGSNIAPVSMPHYALGGLIGGASVPSMLTSSFMRGAPATGGSTGDTHVTVNNHFQHGPSDSHTWSRGVQFELGSML